MNTDRLSNKWVKVGFDRSKRLRVPNDRGTYILANFEGEVLYVGRSVNMGRRFIEHLGSPDKNQVTSKGKPYWFYYFRCSRYEEIKLERGLINQVLLETGELPPLNKIGGTI